MITTKIMSTANHDNKNIVTINLDGIDKHKSEYPLQTKLTAIALRKAGMSFNEIAFKLGVRSHATIINWCTDLELIDDCFNSEAIDFLKRRLVGKAYSNAEIMIDISQEPDKLEKASTLQLTTAASQLIDKALMIEGKSPAPSINVYVKNNVKMQSEIETIDEELARLRTQGTQAIDTPDTLPG